MNIRSEKVVDLKNSPERGRYGERLDKFFESYFGENYAEGILTYKSLGSGVFLDDEGHIVTIAHVVQRASKIYVVLRDGSVMDAKVLRVRLDTDLGIIKTVAPFLGHALKLTDVNDLRIGETVIAIGNPLGLENSVTVGVLSGKDRDFSHSQCGYVCAGLLQRDASINPGNSGGALLNLDGELVGVNLAVVQNAQNIGFAIPADKIREILQEVKE